MTDAKIVRENRWLKPPLHDIGHAALHSEVSMVPILDRHTMARVRRDFDPVPRNYVATIYELLRTIDEALRHPKVQELEILNAQVAMHAIEMQIPFVKEFVVESL